MEPSDDEIIARVQGGERDEFLELFERYYARVESYAWRQLQDAEAARDLASETMLRAYRSIDTYRFGERMPYLGYLLLICRHLALNERARRSARPTQSLDADARLTETLEAPGETPLMHLLEQERRLMLHSALDSLAAEDREIIHLAFERDLSRRDIGAIMSKPSVSAVTSHLYRAMQKLKEAVLRQGYFDSESGRKRHDVIL